MLSGLEQLSQNIHALIALSRQHAHKRRESEQQLTSLRQQYEANRTTLEQVQAERDQLRAERDHLADKIAQAHLLLRTVLEKLPVTPASDDGSHP